MPSAAWSPRFETGLARIDAQHQRLFEDAEAVVGAVLGGAPVIRLRKLLEALMDDTVEHFRTEEELMQKHGYPGFAAHASEHARLLAELRALRAGVESGKLTTLQVTAFLEDWLRHHIQELDLGYAAFLKDRGVR